jgi:hypothetical protein
VAGNCRCGRLTDGALQRTLVVYPMKLVADPPVPVDHDQSRQRLDLGELAHRAVVRDGREGMWWPARKA